MNGPEILKRASVLAFAAACAGLHPARGQAMNTYWAKIGGWDMSSSATKTVNLGGIEPANIVAITVIIHTDPVTIGGSPRVEADRLDRTGFGEVGQTVTPSNYMGRGGSFEVTALSSVTLYRGSDLQGCGASCQHNRFLQGLHSGSTGNRGWVRVDYVGTPVNASQPYAIKTKVLTIGSWNVAGATNKDVNFANFGYPVNRVASFQATLVSDDQIVVSDIIRTGPSGSFGGIAVLTDKVSPPLAVLRRGPYSDYFNGAWSWNFDGTQNRGFIKADYLAAECNEGSGYTRSFIGFAADGGDCHGNNGSGAAAVHVIQTQGGDIWSTADKFAFANKPKTGSDLTIKARVDKIENTNTWARAGIMLRASLAANSRHVAMVVTPKPASGSGNGIGFTVRTSDGGATLETSPNTLSAPYWVLLQKTGSTFKGYVSASGTGDPVSNPSAWTQVGAAATVAFPATYYAGLCQTAGNNTPARYNTSVYSGLNF
ncbi:MAG TPA: hypothetical protein VJ385_07495 [Fibrobacteria bacterium]|nr:hypothetical protein [Fibrobacteria bacterium]